MSAIPNKLFVLELANNHMGDVEHGIRVIREFAAVCKEFPFNFGFKMQYRQLSTFIHPDFRNRMDIKYIKRFSETELTRENTKKLVDEIKKNGFLAICTPFDNDSVQVVVDDGFDVIKIASCSFTDWPLIDAIGDTALPVIGSTAGIQLEDIDNVVSFMNNRGKDFTLMSCVAEYPTPHQHLQLNQLDLLQNRYPEIRVGYSTHENPDDNVGVAMAVAKGVQIFEKHVGLKTEEYDINGYSSSPEQIRVWLKAAEKAFEMAGEKEFVGPSQSESDSLISLRRGAFADRDINVGDRIQSEDISLAIPTQEGHITANDWSKYNQYYATSDIKKGQAILSSNSRVEHVRESIWNIVQRVKNILKEGSIVVPGEAKLEISHHYGLERFDEVGITMITVVNRDYCKKLIAVLPGQVHPEQYHNKKEETFHMLHGKLDLSLDGEMKTYEPGDVVTIQPGVRHEFVSESGAVFEEISSTHFVDDSFYTDESIAKNPNRKTFVSFWMD